MNAQEKFWTQDYGPEYMQRNQRFNQQRGVEGWRKMLAGASEINSLLECGSNIGRNIGFLETVLPEARKSIIEINTTAFQAVTAAHSLQYAYNGPILQSDLPKQAFDLVFTCGVLIHVSPDELVSTMKKMYEYSAKYILIAEYFNRTPVSLEYQGRQGMLYKRDFGRLFLENSSVAVRDYGFLWGYYYDEAGFDDITWWLFEKAVAG